VTTRAHHVLRLGSALALVSLCDLRGQSNYATPYTFTTLARSIITSNVAVDGSGNLYAVEYVNATVRKITPAGLVTTLARIPAVASVVIP
jgi:hypothetical protein